jgi:DNA transformation protein and related proteins
MSDLTNLPNIGPVLAAELNKIGVQTFEDLEKLGSIAVVTKIGQTDRTACYNMLYALEGAIRGTRWHGIPKDERTKLKTEFEQANPQ